MVVKYSTSLDPSPVLGIHEMIEIIPIANGWLAFQAILKLLYNLRVR